MEKHSFGYWLRLKRKSLDLTRKGLADRVGYSAATIRKIEAEERRPSVQVAEQLAEIFNIPQAERTAFLRFARGHSQSVPSETIEESPWHTSTISTRSNLPATTTSLIGREKDVEVIHKYLLTDDIRLITLIGPPGIGKTRLSLETGRTALPNFPDGVFFIALAPLDDPSLIASAIVQAIDYVEAKKLSASQQLIDGIGDKQMLLVMDNCEHLVEAAAQLVSNLLSACSQLKILATSREALRIPGEWLYTVPTLDIPKEISSIDIESILKFPALALFAERARAARSGFELDAGNIQSVAAICSQLDGLPLAIELIAARMRFMSPQALLKRLNNEFVLSTDGMRTVSARQKSLNNAISWSFNLLSPEEQKVFAYFSVFRNGFSLKAAESLDLASVTKKPIMEHIASLLDKSLIQSNLDKRGEPRFYMLVTINQFALSRLRIMRDEEAARNCHLDYFLDFAEKGAEAMRGPAQVEWGERLETELENFRAALEWGVSHQETESVLRLLVALGWPWEVQGHYREARNWLEKIRALPDLGDFSTLYARLLNHIGRHSWSQGNILDARLLLEESRTISLRLETDGECNLAEALNWSGLVVLYGDHNGEQARAMFERGREIYSKLSDQRGMALSTFHLGIVENELKNDETALSLLKQSLSTFQQFGDLFYIARASSFLGGLFHKQGNYKKARFFFEQCINIDEEIQFWSGIADGWFNLGDLYRSQGELQQAGKCYEKSITVCQEHGLIKFDPYFISGTLALYHNNYQLAFQRFSFLLDLVKKSKESENIGTLLTGLAAIAAGNNQPKRSARLYGAGQMRIDTTKENYPQPEREEFERHIQFARDQLGLTTFETFVVEGRTMTMEQAIKYALIKD